MKLNCLVVLLCLVSLSLPALAQQAKSVHNDSSKVKIKNEQPSSLDEEVVIFDSLTVRQQKSYLRQMHRDSVRAHKKVWLSFLGGPSYTPEASFGIGGAVLASFRINKKDSISQRSFLPAGINVSLNGTIVVAGAGALFFNENRFRIYASYGFRNEPSHYYGKGIQNAETVQRSDSTTRFKKQSIVIFPRFVWQVRPNFYLGTLLDVNYSRSTELNARMVQDDYFTQFKSKYVNIGLGGIIQYDTRDDVATPNRGVLLSGIAKIYGRYIGSAYNYQILDLEYRQFQPLFKRAILGWVVRTQIGFNDVPFTELPSFGSPNDLRGYLLGQFRDRSMAYSIVEYRHMLGTLDDLKRGRLLSKFGFVGWVGTGTIGDTPAQWKNWKFNYGVGLRIQIQPRKNFRLDIGKAHGQRGIQFYMNMTEAF